MSGKRTITLSMAVGVESCAAVVGRQEGQGPLGRCFDEVEQDPCFGQTTWEQGESVMQRRCLERAMKKAGLTAEDIDLVLGGDLLNQCVATSFALRGLNVGVLGLYGACSTMGEALALAALMVDGGYAKRAAALVSSHFCTAERQYRMPVPYGSQRPPTAQWTATASGCTILNRGGKGPFVRRVTIGRIVDLGVTDANNMGAAMAPAACDTLSTFFRDTGTKPEDFDRILTGDLGQLGHTLVRELFARSGVDLGEGYDDCGRLLYDRKGQDMHMGGSGCGCSAAVLNGQVLPGMAAGKWKRVLFAPTGALLSPTTTMQGESIPGICHAVELTMEGN